MNTRPVGAELFHVGGWKDGSTDRQTDMTKLTVIFRNFVIAPNKMTIFQCSSSVTTLMSRHRKTQTAYFCNFRFFTFHLLGTAYQFTFKLFTSFLIMVPYILEVQHVSRKDDR